MSGSVTDSSDCGEKNIYEFSANLSKRPILNNNNITSGFGLAIESLVIASKLEEL